MELTAVAQWLNTVFADFDAAVTIAVHKLFDFSLAFFTPFMEFVSVLGKGGIFLIILSLALTFFKKTRRYGTAMCIGLAIAFALVNLYLKVVIARPRPYLDENSVFYQFWTMVGQHTESDKSFPSGHTNAAFATMIPIFILGRKRWSWIALAFAILMGISRIYLCVHYPTDVIGGAITGTLGGIIGVLIATRLPQKWYEWDLLHRKGRHEDVRAR
ncbi:MAG: phosphatase PAP2 family protein [Oscillospiraceae bacterium]|nr:phosphatase PAP2 family protein [Oscillospiraceae bacterium]